MIALNTAFPTITDEVLCPRTDLVNSLATRLIAQGILHVRGTPASGKSILCELLKEKLEESNNVVVFEDGWPDEITSVKKFTNYFMENIDTSDWDDKHPIVILVDEAQESYKNKYLWNTFIKKLHLSKYYLVLFASYGSAGNKQYINHGTPPVLKESQRVAMQWTNDEQPVGLLFNRDEALDLFDRLAFKDKRNNPDRFFLDNDLKDYIFSITAGHVGAIDSIYDTIICNQGIKNRCRRDKTKQVTLDYFNEIFLGTKPHPERLIRDLASSRFGRGLIERKDIHNIYLGHVLQTLIKNYLCSITQSEEDLIKALENRYGEKAKHEEAIIELHKGGKIFKILIFEPGSSLMEEYESYCFPSPLHTWMCQSLLCDWPKGQKCDRYATAKELAIALVKRFRPSTFQHTVRNIGAAPGKAICEDHFSHELYRNVSEVVHDDWIFNPQFGDKNKKDGSAIDFFVSSVKWGLEITKESSKIVEHYNRFLGNGAYARWIGSGDMKDFVLMNLSVSRLPKKTYKDFPNLLHFEFRDNYRELCVYDNMMNQIGQVTRLQES